MRATINIYEGDCLPTIKEMADNSVDAVVTDPPYGLSFMGKKWDYEVPKVEIWKECLRVLKPGGYILSFAGTRTQHRMAINIEDAGFEIRDMIAWVYGSGFPKSLNIGKAVDKLQGNERKITGKLQVNTKVASEFEGWGTALKPAFEPITVARKPLSEKTVTKNCLKWGTGGINIDGCRVGYQNEADIRQAEAKSKVTNNRDQDICKSHIFPKEKVQNNFDRTQGRFPANFIHDGSGEVMELFPNTKSGGGIKAPKGCKLSIFRASNHEEGSTYNANSGSAARFFYCAKASKDERQGSTHPTVKPITLMEYLIRLVSREGAVILDPFMGSGTTGIACINTNRNFIGIELDKTYFEIAKKRIDNHKAQLQLY